jgi:hypothetical protein
VRFVEGQGPLPVKERKEDVVRVVIGACNLIQEYQPVGVLDALQKVRRGKGRRAFPKLHRTNERGARVGGCPHVDSINLATRRGSQVGNQLRLATAGRPGQQRWLAAVHVPHAKRPGLGRDDKMGWDRDVTPRAFLSSELPGNLIRRMPSLAQTCCQVVTER